MIFVDGLCPDCGNMCGNNGGDRLRCKCGWVGERIEYTHTKRVSTPIGEWLKAYQHRTGVLIRDMATAMGIKPSEYSAIITRGRKPTLDEISRFIYAFEVPVEETAELLEIYSKMDDSEKTGEGGRK